MKSLKICQILFKENYIIYKMVHSQGPSYNYAICLNKNNSAYLMHNTNAHGLINDFQLIIAKIIPYDL